MARKAIAHYNTLSHNRTAEDLTVYAEFGRRLQARMLELGWNQTELARRASAYLPKADQAQKQGHIIGRDQISNYIRGKHLPRPPALAALAKALKCKQEDLLPPEHIPSVTQPIEEGPLMEFRGVGGGRVAIRLNRVVSHDTAMAIMSLLAKEDA